jgi:hypothetical protein
MAYLAAVRWPICFIVEGLGVPYGFEQNLRKANGMRIRTLSAGFESTGRGIRNVLAMIRRVQVHAVPTSRAIHIHQRTHQQSDTCHTHKRWLIMIPLGHGCFGNSSVSGSRVPSFCMQMYVNWRKSRVRRSCSTPSVRKVSMIADDAGLGAYHAAVRGLDALLSALRNALVCPVTGFEVYYCGPVIAWKLMSVHWHTLAHSQHALKSSDISHVVHVESLTRSWPFAGSMVTLKEFWVVLGTMLEGRCSLWNLLRR